MICVVTCHCMDYLLCCTLSALGNQSTANIYQYEIINLQVDCIKQKLELCTNIQHINNKSDLIRSLKFRAKILDITTRNTSDTDNILKHS